MSIVNPSDLLPLAFDLHWNITIKECVARLKTVPVKKSSRYIVLLRTVQESQREFHLLFNAAGLLQRIETPLYVSRTFWDDYTEEEMESNANASRAYYDQLLVEYQSILGQPHFSGTWQHSNYPPDQTAALLTYWNNPEGRMQLSYEHPEKEYPFSINFACHVPD